MIRVHIVISGQVQGVFFRRSGKVKADELSVVGFIKNLGDGKVEVMAQGEKKNVDEFVKWCKKGPPLSKVEKVEVEVKSDLHDFDDFSIHD